VDAQAELHVPRRWIQAKQFGRNPEACRSVVGGGLGAAVAVDVQCMEALRRHQVRVGHVGHLVQPHRGAEDAVISASPEVVTVFSLEVTARLAAAAKRAGASLDVLLRVRAPGDTFYFGHGGGFPLDDIVSCAQAVQKNLGVRVVGVTSFPCLLADREARTVQPTPNLSTVLEAARRLEAAGFDVRQVNTPGTNSTGVLELLATAGATHIEPGNALHGTTPLQLFDSSAPEVPAIAFLSEVSHIDGDDAYVLAGGYYADKVLGDYELHAVVGSGPEALERVLPLDVAPDGAISYYAILRGAKRAGVRVGDSVVSCFRPQSFVTRGRTQAVYGLRSGRRPTFGARYDQEARTVEGVG
jgi:predicted amino acid racemase